jgi:hypothetical protein
LETNRWTARATATANENVSSVRKLAPTGATEGVWGRDSNKGGISTAPSFPLEDVIA